MCKTFDWFFKIKQYNRRWIPYSDTIYASELLGRLFFIPTRKRQCMEIFLMSWFFSHGPREYHYCVSVFYNWHKMLYNLFSPWFWNEDKQWKKENTNNFWALSRFVSGNLYNKITKKERTAKINFGDEFYYICSEFNCA